MRNRLEAAAKVNGGNHRKGREAGFTIIEISVSVIIFTIVMGTIYGLLKVARSGRLNVNQHAEVLQNARIAINTMGRDAINAGVGYPNLGANVPDNRISALLGGAADADTDPDVLTPVFAQNNLRVINARNDQGVIVATATDQVTFLFIDDTFNNGISLPISNILNQGAELTIAPGFLNTPCTLGDIYIIAGQNGSALGVFHDGNVPAGANTNKLTFAVGDALGIDTPGATSPVGNILAPASVQRVSWVSYFLVQEAGDDGGTGTLMRRAYGGPGGWVDQPLAFGVENMQIQYLLVDGNVVDAPAQNQMDDIRQVRISVSVRSPDIDPATNLPLRSTLTATFSTRNLVYEKI